jgi:hypothetical protein
MAIDDRKLLPDVREDILENRRIDDFETMSVYDAFDMFLTYNGIIGFTAFIISAYESIKAAEIKKGGN